MEYWLLDRYSEGYCESCSTFFDRKLSAQKLKAENIQDCIVEVGKFLMGYEYRMPETLGSNSVEILTVNQKIDISFEVNKIIQDEKKIKQEIRSANEEFFEREELKRLTKKYKNK